MSRRTHPPRRTHRIRAKAVGAAAALAVLLTVLTGCSSTPTQMGELSALAKASSPEPPPQLPDVAPWGAQEGEMQAELKTTATRLLEVAGTWDSAEGGSAAAVIARTGVGVQTSSAPVEVSADPVEDPLVALESLAAAEADAATVAVTYPQLGGLGELDASVMVALQQQVLTGSTIETRSATYDVRLHRGDAGVPWSVVAVYGGPSPVTDEPNVPTGPAAAVIDRDNIDLAGAAAGDVSGGLVDDSVMEVLLELAGSHTIGVSVMVTGHPWEVFGTERQSNHSRGRAMDIWSIDGLRVDDPRLPREVVTQVMLAAGAAGATEVGGPVDPNGAGPGYFSDALHADHVHVGLTPDKRPAAGSL